MNKVYVLTLEDVSNGTIFSERFEVYADYNKAKREFDLLVKDYLDNNDFSTYEIEKKENNFIVYEEGNYNDEHIEIYIKECNIIE